MTHRLIGSLYVVFLTLLPASAGLADTLLVSGLNEAQATAGKRPTRGMSMQKVAAAWGEPANKSEAVGKPPITRWDYAGFSVYFEYDHVIHAVMKHGA
jgi:hypothetical protein